jgi:hypothetical protein
MAVRWPAPSHPLSVIKHDGRGWSDIADARRVRLLCSSTADGNDTGDLNVPERGLQVSPFMMFMLFMGMVYVVLTLQQRATRRDRADPDAKGGGGGAADGGGGDGQGAEPTAPGPGPAVD